VGRRVGPGHNGGVAMALVEQLADGLGMPVEEVEGFVRARYGTLTWSDDLAVAVRMDLDGPHCVRSVPATWWPGSDPDAGTGATRMR
jgi:hypothetical protein